MTRVVVVSILLAAAFILLFVTFCKNEKRNNSSHVNLNRRFGYNKTPTFDPLFTKMERQEDGHGGKHEVSKVLGENFSLVDEVGDPHDYFSEEGKLNITLRLFILFPLLDNAPKDGVIDFKELGTWNTRLAIDRLNYRAEKEMYSLDKDGDNAISFKEYLPNLTDAEIEKNGMEHGEAGWWKEQFVNADVDKNGTLNFNELKDFLQPEDSNNEEIQKWLLREKMKRMDYDEDGKLDLKEFHDGAYDIYKNYVEFETAGADPPTPQETFAKLDVNNDEVLTVEELKPILSYLYPGELSYAKYFTSYLIHEADDNRDGVLTLDEMLNHEFIFYSTVYDDNHDDDDDDDLYHDEL